MDMEEAHVQWSFIATDMRTLRMRKEGTDPTYSHTNIMNKHFRKADNGWSSGLGFKTLAHTVFTHSFGPEWPAGWQALSNMTIELHAP